MAYRWFICAAIFLVNPAPGLSQDPGESGEPEFGLRVDVLGDAIPTERWLELFSKNFHVIGNADEGRLRRLAADLELFREQVALVLPRARETSSTPTRVVVLRNGELYRPFELSDDGYLLSGDDVNYIVLKDADPPRDIYRHYVRLLLVDSVAPLPRWLAEGLAEYYVTFESNWIGGSRWIQVGGRDKEFNGVLRDPMPLDAMFGIGQEAFEYDPASPRNPFNATAWSLVHFLLNRRSEWLPDFFGELDSGSTAEEAAARVFGMSVAELEGDLREHIRDQRVPRLDPRSGAVSTPGWFVFLAGFSLDESLSRLLVNFFSADSETDFLQGEAESVSSLESVPVNRDFIKADLDAVDARLMTEAETQHYRGDLLARIGRAEAAEAALEFSLRIEPGLAAAHRALGRLRTAQGRYDEAEASLLRALELDDGDYRSHYQYAALLLAEPDRSPGGQEVERARAALVRSLDLEPEFVPAAERLARLDLERGGDLAFVLDLVEYAIRRSPGRPALIALLEEIWVALGGDIGSVPSVARILALGPEEPPLGPGQDASDDAREAARRVSQEFFPAGPESEAVAVQVSVQSRSAAGDEGSGIPPSIPDGEIVRLTPRTPVEGAEVRGVLTGLECTEGLTVLLEVDGSIRRFHTDRPETIEFLGYGGGVGESIACGPLTPALPATITYRPGASEESLGEPLLIEIDSP